MDTLWVIRLAIFSIFHWILALILLNDLAYRRRVLGGKKWPWALAIIFLTWAGSILYLLCHPQVFYDGGNRD